MLLNFITYICFVTSPEKIWSSVYSHQYYSTQIYISGWVEFKENYIQEHGSWLSTKNPWQHGWWLMKVASSELPVQFVGSLLKNLLCTSFHQLDMTYIISGRYLMSLESYWSLIYKPFILPPGQNDSIHKTWLHNIIPLLFLTSSKPQTKHEFVLFHASSYQDKIICEVRNVVWH